MCIICVQFNKDRDFADAWRMIKSARREKVLDEKHLRSVEYKIWRDGVDAGHISDFAQIDEEERLKNERSQKNSKDSDG